MQLANSLRRQCGALLLAATLVLPASAQTLIWDTFDAPSPANLQVVSGEDDVWFTHLSASVPGGIRQTLFNLYSNPNNGDSAFAVGDGLLTVFNSDSQTVGEALALYGAFTRPTMDPNVGGPLLGMDLTAYNFVRLDFLSTFTYVNAIAVFYTSAPLDPGNPLYYTTSFNAGQAPAIPGGPNTLFLPLVDKASFNWAQVDGMVLLLDRATDQRGQVYALDTIALTAAIPEPGTYALMAAGLAFVGFVAKRRRG
jgi:hypothetical protein